MASFVSGTLLSFKRKVLLSPSSLSNVVTSLERKHPDLQWMSKLVDDHRLQNSIEHAAGSLKPGTMVMDVQHAGSSHLRVGKEEYGFSIEAHWNLLVNGQQTIFIVNAG